MPQGNSLAIYPTQAWSADRKNRIEEAVLVAPDGRRLLLHHATTAQIAALLEELEP